MVGGVLEDVDPLVGSDCSRGLGMVEGSIAPRICGLERVSSRSPGGWIGSYSSVASLPASWRITLAPPGWESIKSENMLTMCT